METTIKDFIVSEPHYQEMISEEKFTDSVLELHKGNYCDRFLAEYITLAIRIRKLKTMLAKWDELNFVPTFCKEMYETQLKAMLTYFGILEARAYVEKMVLNETIG